MLYVCKGLLIIKVVCMCGGFELVPGDSFVFVGEGARA